MSEYIENSQERKQALKELILDLHAGLDLAQARARFAALIGDISAQEIARLEQELIEDGLPVEEVKALCDVHVAVFQESLDQERAPEMTPGHPVHTFKAENFALGELLKLMEEAVAELPSASALERLRRFAEQMAQVERIYSRKENLLFPILERHGVTGPSSVMWGTHDDIRAQVKIFQEALRHSPKSAAELFTPLAEAIRSMFYKEEHILYPTALKMLSEAEWAEIRDGSDEIGYCLIRPGNQWQPAVEPAQAPREEAPLFEGGMLPLDTGGLTREQVNLMLTHLPIDVTFVDEQDTVRYFSQSRHERIFTRTPAIIGRKVQNCHPPASVHVVNRLLDEFRSGQRDVAEFWIQMAGQFIHIRYFALRDEEGRYRGTIEVSQDLSPLRALEGERRLLDEAP
ncbi:MAG: DUF438 domain-containing protein [Anaerolineae bacterium]|nr:DUF438 domain-containing protein [Anaerolineae bacterium]